MGKPSGQSEDDPKKDVEHLQEEIVMMATECVSRTEFCTDSDSLRGVPDACRCSGERRDRHTPRNVES